MGPSPAYDRALDRAALLLLAALRDHANPQFSAVQLEALRLRGGLLAAAGPDPRPASVRSFFADLRDRTTERLAAELKAARAPPEVAAEMNRILGRLLDSIEGIFAAR